MRPNYPLHLESIEPLSQQIISIMIFELVSDSPAAEKIEERTLLMLYFLGRVNNSKVQPHCSRN